MTKVRYTYKHTKQKYDEKRKDIAQNSCRHAQLFFCPPGGSMLSNIITFDKSARNDVLDMFNKAIDEEGYIVLKNNHKQKVLTIDGEEIRASEFAGIKRGSEIFIKSDLNSLIALADMM